MTELFQDNEYKNWLIDLNSKIKQSQIKAALAVNSQLILLYWELGKQITDKQQNAKWGIGFIDQLSKDLKSEFPEMSGFSKRNLEIIRQWVSFYGNFIIAKQLVSQLPNDFEKSQQLVGKYKNDQQINEPFDLEINNPMFQIPWGHHILIIQKIKNQKDALFYIEKTIENNWSRSVLEYQIETNLHQRQGKAISNFKYTLPEIESDLAQQLLKDPYNFEFLSLSTEAKEKDLEQKLIQHITQFLLELGKGFAYLGKQYSLKVGRKDYRIDLLFYHIQLKSYIVIELKMKEFEPEFIGKLNFYISAINELVKTENDNPTIGILLCKNKDNFEVEFALKDINNPIGVSEFKYAALPENIKKALPTLEEFENELKKIHNE